MTLEERAAVGVPLGTLLSSDAGGKFVLLAVAVGDRRASPPSRPSVRRRAGDVRRPRRDRGAAAMLARAAGGHAARITRSRPHPVAALRRRRHVDRRPRVARPRRLLRASSRRRCGGSRGSRGGAVHRRGVRRPPRRSNELGWGWWLHPFQNGYSTTLVVKLADRGAADRARCAEPVPQRPAVRGASARGPCSRTVGAEIALAGGRPRGHRRAHRPPAAGAEAEAAPDAAKPLVVTGSDFATTTKVRLEISPGTVGPNAFVADVPDFDSGEPVDAHRVSLTFAARRSARGRSTLELEPAARGNVAAARHRARAAGDLVRHRARRGAGGLRRGPAQVTPQAPEQHVDVSRAQGQPDLYTITLQGGLQIQAYVDPGEPGRTNQVHVTAFDTDGAELPLAQRDPHDPPAGRRAVPARDAPARRRALRREHRPHDRRVVVRHRRAHA